MAKVPVEINLEFTPNPNTLKYTVNMRILPVGAEFFTSIEEAEKYSPLATDLFGIDEITAVMIGADFVTITRSSQDTLRELNKNVMQTIKEHLESGKPLCQVRPEKPIEDETDPTIRRIREILDSEIRPAVAADGGDITFEAYENGNVYLNMIGACSGCPSSAMTLKMGIQTRLQKEFPEIKDVIPV